jgi:hypothetical protein
MIKHRPFFRRKVLNSFFVCEARTPVERLQVVSFKDNETLEFFVANCSMAISRASFDDRSIE